MNKLFNIAVLAALLVSCQSAAIVVPPTSPINAGLSVRHLEINGVLACTTFRLEDKWVTAKHCTLAEDGKPYPALRISGRPVTWVTRDPDDDVAYLTVDLAAPPLRLAARLPVERYGPDAEDICYVGFPYYSAPLAHFGTWCGKFNGIDSDGDIRLGTMVDGGASGSPLFNSRSEVIGVVVSSHRRGNYSFAEPIVK